MGYLLKGNGVGGGRWAALPKTVLYIFLQIPLFTLIWEGSLPTPHPPPLLNSSFAPYVEIIVHL